MKKLLLLTFTILGFLSSLYSQEEGNTNSGVLRTKEMYGGVVIHTSGWGISFRTGKHKTGTRKRFWEADFVGMKSAKEYKYNPNYDNSKSYVLGKLNDFYILRAGKGIQKIINHKPFWGGVELRYCGFIGVSLGITKPIYLYILNVSSNPYEGYTLTEERYDPAKHDIDNIYGRAPFTKGLDQLQFHPGIYGKFGLNFEYGANEKFVKAIEIGTVVDVFSNTIPIMAYEKNKNVFVSLYFSVNFGGRYN